MNLLSICLYLADVMSNFSALFFALGLVGILMIVITIIANTVYVSDYNNYKPKEQCKSYDWNFTVFKKIWIPIAFIIFAALIPSTNTVYLIAASEIAEVGYKSEIGEKLQKVVNEKLDAYIVELTNPSEEAAEAAAENKVDQNVVQDTAQAVKQLAEQVQTLEKMVNQ